METLYIGTALPRGTRVFAFGSYVQSVPHPSDLDILVVYDPTVVPPARAYEAYEPLREELGITTGLPVDMTLLTVSEEAALRFVESEHCVEILTKGD